MICVLQSSFARLCATMTIVKVLLASSLAARIGKVGSVSVERGGRIGFDFRFALLAYNPLLSKVICK